MRQSVGRVALEGEGGALLALRRRRHHVAGSGAGGGPGGHGLLLHAGGAALRPAAARPALRRGAVQQVAGRRVGAVSRSLTASPCRDIAPCPPVALQDHRGELRGALLRRGPRHVGERGAGAVPRAAAGQGARGQGQSRPQPVSGERDGAAGTPGGHPGTPRLSLWPPGTGRPAPR